VAGTGPAARGPVRVGPGVRAVRTRGRARVWAARAAAGPVARGAGPRDRDQEVAADFEEGEAPLDAGVVAGVLDDDEDEEDDDAEEAGDDELGAGSTLFEAERESFR
jgi:hypothetical protein